MYRSESYWLQLAWAAKTPILLGVAGAYVVNSVSKFRESPEGIKVLEEAKAADAAYQAELLRAYKFTYPEDPNVTRQELREFEQTARNIDETFRESNFDYQNHVYNSLMKLYGSQQGKLEEAYQAALPNPEFGMNVLEGLGYVAIGIAAITAVNAFFVANRRAKYGY